MHCLDVKQLIKLLLVIENGVLNEYLDKFILIQCLYMGKSGSILSPLFKCLRDLWPMGLCCNFVCYVYLFVIICLCWFTCFSLYYCVILNSSLFMAWLAFIVDVLRFISSSFDWCLVCISCFLVIRLL